MKSLEELFKEYNCDKGHKHQYHTVYEEIFKDKRNDEINFLEIGIDKGYSTSAFHEYFKNGTIVGIDIFKRNNPEDVKILKEDRVKWVKGNSMNPTINHVLSNKYDLKYDYILDDGAHYPEANKLTFKYLHKLLKPGGSYLIEDVFPIEIMTPKEKNIPWFKRHADRYTDLMNNDFLYEINQSGLKIIRHDLRKITNHYDSYIIQLIREK